MRRKRPVILGIVGDSAAGKTTLTRGLATILGPGRVTHVCTDDYHRYDRRERAELQITALHPDCNYIDILQLHMERMHYGQPILKPVYDHSTGSLVRPEYLVPSEFVIVEGLLGFSTPVLRQFIDIKVYLDPPEELRHHWKIKRDTTKRGYTEEQVRAELIKREADSAAFIRPQRECADIVVRFQPPARGGSTSAANLDVSLVLRPTIPHPDLTYLIDRRRQHQTGIRLELGRDAGRPADFLLIEGAVARNNADELEGVIWRHLPEVTPLPTDRLGVYQDRAELRHSPQLALTQLLLAYHLLRQYNEVDDLPFAAPVAALSRVTGVVEEQHGDRQVPVGAITAAKGSG